MHGDWTAGKTDWHHFVYLEGSDFYTCAEDRSSVLPYTETPMSHADYLLDKDSSSPTKTRNLKNSLIGLRREIQDPCLSVGW